jgi:hypothetical protein
VWSRHRAVTATPASVSAGTSSPAPPRAAHVSPGMMTRSNTPCACAGRRCHITSRHVSRHGRRSSSHGARHYSTAWARTMQLRIGASSTGWSPSPRFSGLPPSSCPGNPCGHSRITRPRMRRNAYSQDDDKNKHDKKGRAQCTQRHLQVRVHHHRGVRHPHPPQGRNLIEERPHYQRVRLRASGCRQEDAGNSKDKFSSSPPRAGSGARSSGAAGPLSRAPPR